MSFQVMDGIQDLNRVGQSVERSLEEDYRI